MTDQSNSFAFTPSAKSVILISRVLLINCIGLLTPMNDSSINFASLLSSTLVKSRRWLKTTKFHNFLTYLSSMQAYEFKLERFRSITCSHKLLNLKTLMTFSRHYRIRNILHFGSLGGTEKKFAQKISIPLKNQVSDLQWNFSIFVHTLGLNAYRIQAFLLLSLCSLFGAC